MEGQKQLARNLSTNELASSKHIIIPGGNLGNVSALAKGFDDCLAMGLISKKPRIIVARAAAATIYQAYQRGFDQLVL